MRDNTQIQVGQGHDNARASAPGADTSARIAKLNSYLAKDPAGAAYNAANRGYSMIKSLADEPDIATNGPAQVAMIDSFVKTASGSTRATKAQFDKVFGAKSWEDAVQVFKSHAESGALLAPDQIAKIVQASKLAKDEAETAAKADPGTRYFMEQKDRLLSGGGEPGGSQAGGDMPRPSTPAEAAKLPPGTQFIAPDGSIRTRK
jgi:hypothetical protein